MTVVNSRPTLTINTSTAREHWLEGMLRHEIGEDTVDCGNTMYKQTVNVGANKVDSDTE